MIIMWSDAARSSCSNGVTLETEEMKKKLLATLQPEPGAKNTDPNRGRLTLLSCSLLPLRAPGGGVNAQAGIFLCGGGGGLEKQNTKSVLLFNPHLYKYPHIKSRPTLIKQMNKRVI